MLLPDLPHISARRPDLTDEELKNLIPSKIGNVHYAFDGVAFEKNAKSLIMLMGVPGSGKSTMAEKLKDLCEGYDLTSKIVSMDCILSNYIMKNGGMFDIDTDFAKIQMLGLQEEFEDADEYDVIILDGTFLSITDRFVVLKPISDYFSNVIGVFLDTNVEELRRVQSERLFKRISEEDFEYYTQLARMNLEMEKNLSVGFDEVYIVLR